MANYNCEACSELKTDAPNLVVNGMTETEVASLKNNTGLNPSSGNDDCTDLNNMNDCLIGNMVDEIDAYDVCDWKEYTKNLVDNGWTVFKGVISAICGLWTNIANLLSQINALKSKITDLCNLINAQMSHPVLAYGTNPNISDTSQIGGVIANKNGVPIVTPLARSEVASDTAWKQQNVGFRYGKLETTGCTSGCIRYEWIAPNIYAYRFNADVTPEAGDLIWSIDKASVVGRMGMSSEMWAIREQNPIGWASDWTAGGIGLIGLRLSVEDNRFCLRYTGVIGTSESNLSGKTINPPTDQAERMYTFSC